MGRPVVEDALRGRAEGLSCRKARAANLFPETHTQTCCGHSRHSEDFSGLLWGQYPERGGTLAMEPSAPSGVVNPVVLVCGGLPEPRGDGELLHDAPRVEMTVKGRVGAVPDVPRGGVLPCCWAVQVSPSARFRRL